jgi:MFS family permease
MDGTDRRSVVPAVLTLFAGGLFLGLDQSVFGIIVLTLQHDLGFGSAGSAWAGGIQSVPEGLAGFFIAGALSDRLGNRKLILLPSLAAFALTAWLTALSVNLATLLVARGLMGVFAGGWIAMMFAMATELPAPRWRALTVGFALASQPVGTGLIAPVVLPHLAEGIGWRWTYLVAGAPALLVALIGIWTVPTAMTSHIAPLDSAGSALSLGEVFRHRNVVLSAVISALLFATLTLFVVFGVEYLFGVGLTVVQAGLALSGWGLGGVVGALLVPKVSDWVGRRPTAVVGSGLSAAAVLLFVLAPVGVWTFVAMVLIGIVLQGTLALVVMLIPGETVPDRLRGKAIGLSDIGTTTVGGGIFVIVLGSIGASLGLRATFLLGVVCCLVSAVLARALRETAPRLTAAGFDGLGDGQQAMLVEPPAQQPHSQREAVGQPNRYGEGHETR